MRVRFWQWLCGVAKVAEGEMPPRWLVGLRWVLTPIEMLEWWMGGGWDAAFCPTIELNGVKFGLFTLEKVLRPGPERWVLRPGSERWVRVVRVEQGRALFETRTGEEIEQQVKHWRKVDAFLQEVLKKEQRKESEG